MQLLSLVSVRNDVAWITLLCSFWRGVDKRPSCGLNGPCTCATQIIAQDCRRSWPPPLLMSDPAVNRRHPHTVHRLPPAWCMLTLSCSFFLPLCVWKAARTYLLLEIVWSRVAPGNMTVAHTVGKSFNVDTVIIIYYTHAVRGAIFIHVVQAFYSATIQTPDSDHCACQLALAVFPRQDVYSRGHARITGSGQNLRLSRRGVRPGNGDNENESISVIVSVRQSGRLVVPTDNPLSVGLVSNNTTTMSEESLNSIPNILKQTELTHRQEGPLDLIMMLMCRVSRRFCPVCILN